jgi:hypothetical protein
MYDRIQVTGCVSDIAGFLMPGLKPSMFSLSITCKDNWIVHIAFGLLEHDLGFFILGKV